MGPKLIFDVGVHRGDDSAYYLHKGFRVVGVEANPVMVDRLRKRFAAKAPSEGRTSRPVKVRTLRFASLLKRHGVPLYCKIDIEGNDHLCLRGIDADDKPAYISVEMDLAQGNRDLSLLQGLGYRRFKFISQLTLSQASDAPDRSFVCAGTTSV